MSRRIAATPLLVFVFALGLLLTQSVAAAPRAAQDCHPSATCAAAAKATERGKGGKKGSGFTTTTVSTTTAPPLPPTTTSGSTTVESPGSGSGSTPTGTTTTGTETGTTSTSTTDTTIVASLPGGALVPPAGTIYFGAKPGYNQTDVTAFEALIGQRIAIRQVFVPWLTTWPDARQSDDWQHGRIPLVSWLGTTLADINSGSYDTMIHQRAKAVKALGFPIFIRPMHEMNGTWYAWSREPSAYIAAFRRIHNIFEQEGATNAVWIWCPSVPQGDWDAYYPGDAYVDWIGGDGYNWGTSRTGSKWQSFSTIFGAFYSHYAERKPIMIAETGSAEQGGDKAQWVADARQALERDFPGIKAWIHQQYTDGAADWRVNSSATALDAYKALAADPYFAAHR
jgi:Glycosyl hydrolase family 26